MHFWVGRGRPGTKNLLVRSVLVGAHVGSVCENVERQFELRIELLEREREREKLKVRIVADNDFFLGGTPLYFFFCVLSFFSQSAFPLPLLRKHSSSANQILHTHTRTRLR